MRLFAAPNSDAKRAPFYLAQANLHLFLHDVSAGRLAERRVVVASQTGGRRRHLARSRFDPFEPMRPPASTVLRRLFQPRFCARRGRASSPEKSLGVARRIEQALYMAAVGEHEGAPLSEE